MKLRNLFVVAAVAGLAACSSPYRATDTVVVAPATVQTSFTTQYPTASNVVWYNYDAAMVPIEWDLTDWTTLDAGDYLVRFDEGSDSYYAWYDDQGTWIGSAYIVKDYGSIPAAINTTIHNNYPAYTIIGVNREQWKDRMAYEVELKGSSNKVKLLVDSNGNIIKQKTKSLY